MTVNYDRVWRTMNDLELVTSKICSIRANIDVAIDKLQEHQYDKAELLMNAAYEYLEYYLQEFDDKFKLAWQATVGDLRDGDKEAYDTVMKEREYYEGKVPLSCDKDDPSPECKGAWNSFWDSYQGSSVSSVQYTEEELNAMCDAAEKADKVKKWVLPVEEAKDADTDETEYFVSFPDDLLEAANLNEGDQVEWSDNKNGTYTIRKVTKPLSFDEC